MLASNSKTTNPADPYPIQIFNEEKTISDNKIGKYINSEFNYYLNIYENNIQFGLPYKNWYEMPNWLVELHKLFNKIEKEYEVYQIKRQYLTK